MVKFFNLMEPIQIGTLELRNRIIMPAMHLGMCSEGICDERIATFYEHRAKGGVGLIIIGGCAVEKRAQGVDSMIGIYDDKFIPGLKMVVDAVHKHGAKICAQLYHAGAYAFKQFSGEQPVSASEVFSNFSKQMPRALSTEEVGEVIQHFVDAARRAKDAGFDAVEIISSAGYLIDQFLSPIKNLRTDKYGSKTLKERLTFPLELIDRLRSTNLGLTIGCRFGGDDFVKDSNRWKERAEIAKAYDEHGIEYFNVTGGWHETKIPQIPITVPNGAYAYLAKNIKQNVKAKVFATNRINDPVLAERLLQDGYADAICIGRAQISDPEFALKVKENRIGEIRRCIGCNQGCFDNIFKLKPISCLLNPLAGRESKPIPKTEQPKKIIIVGGGPAGLEALYRAHLAGHDVKLYEKDDKLGGQLNVAWLPPGKKDIKHIIEYYYNDLNKIGARYYLNTDVSVPKLKEENPDIIMLATGVKFNIPPIDGIKTSRNCHFADHVLAGDAPLGNKVTVIGGAATGVETAIWIARRGRLDPEIASYLSFYNALQPEQAMEMTYKGDRTVYLIDILPEIGTSIGKSTRWVYLDELKKLGIQIIVNAKITKITDNAIEYFIENTEHKLDNLDTIVLATGVKPNEDLYETLKPELGKAGFNPKIIKLGDCRKVGTILDAIHSGFDAVKKL